VLSKVAWLVIASIAPSVLGESLVGPNRWTPTELQGYISSVVVDESQNRVYAIDFSDIGFARVWTSQDDGQTWSKLLVSNEPLAAYVSAVAVDPSAPGSVYVGTAGCNPRPPLGCYGQVSKTTDNASHWQLLQTPVFPAVGAIAICPSRTEVVYVAAYTSPFAIFFVLRSSDGGDSWTQLPSVSLGTVSCPWSGGVTILVDASSADTVYLGGNGLLKSLDGGTTWSATALRVCGVTALAQDTRTGSIYAATDSGLYSTRDDGATWNMIGFAGGVRALELDSRSGRLFAATVREGVQVTADGGLTWSQVGSGLPQVPVLGLALFKRSVLFASPHSNGVYKIQLHQVRQVPFR